MYSLVDLEGVIGWEEGDGIVDFWVLEDICWDLIQDSSVLLGLSYYSDVSREHQ